MSLRNRDAIRVLHVVGGMNRGGVETWLMHVLRNIDRERFVMDFLVHTREACLFDEEIVALGSRIIPCPAPHRSARYFMNFNKAIKVYGPYDIIHSHVHHFSGFTLKLARMKGIPFRIAHSHNDTLNLQGSSQIARRMYYSVSRHLIVRHATHRLACSEKAFVALYGKNALKKANSEILYYGIDLTPFNEHCDSSAVRSELNIPEKSLVLGHVGSFTDQKNHVFLLEVFKELIHYEPNARLLLVGDGPNRPQIVEQAERLGIAEKVILLGVRSDVPRLMSGAMDVFVFPSHYEGLPVVLLEAQAAGIPSVFSDIISEEVCQVRPLMHRVSLSRSASEWATRVLAVLREDPKVDRLEALELMRASAFNIGQSVRRVEDVYSNY